jgi:hypothetical protein
MSEFIFFKGLDQGGCDIRRHATETVPDCAIAHNETIAVNTLGYAKAELLDLAPSKYLYRETDGIYVKKTYISSISNRFHFKTHHVDNTWKNHLQLYSQLIEDPDTDAYVVVMQGSQLFVQYDTLQASLSLLPIDFHVANLGQGIALRDPDTFNTNFLYYASRSGRVHIAHAYAISKSGAHEILNGVIPSTVDNEDDAWNMLLSTCMSGIICAQTSKLQLYISCVGHVPYAPYCKRPMFDWVYYINLRHRTDRLVEIQTELEKVGVSDKATRIEAVYTPENGAKGCGQSHILALETFLASSHKNALILEDDFQWTTDPRLSISMCLQHHSEWDVIMLAANTLNSTYHSPWAVKIESAATTSGYAITRTFAQILLNYWKHIAPITKPSVACDENWRDLQPSSNWLCLSPKVGHQRKSYSDIAKRIVDFSNEHWSATTCR